MRQLTALLLLAALPAAPSAGAELAGVNLAGAEFGGLQSVHGQGYIYPGEAEMRAFRSRGATLFRVPVRWERLQPSLGGPLAAEEMARLDKVIGTANGMGVTVIIDVHNYGRYARQPLGSPTVPTTSLRDLWTRLAQRYKSNPRVIFGLMNEPIRIGADEWAAIAGDLIIGIRSTGARNLILVPGAYWSGAHSWTKAMRANPSNAEALKNLADPADNIAFDIHQYFDANSSGTTTSCVAPDKVEARLAVATNWLRATGRRAMLTEFGGDRSPACLAALKTALDHLDANPQWIGWTAWASSAWFGSYPLNLYPLQGEVPPQLELMTPYFTR